MLYYRNCRPRTRRNESAGKLLSPNWVKLSWSVTKERELLVDSPKQRPSRGTENSFNCRFQKFQQLEFAFPENSNIRKKYRRSRWEIVTWYDEVALFRCSPNRTSIISWLLAKSITRLVSTSCCWRIIFLLQNQSRGNEKWENLFSFSL